MTQTKHCSSRWVEFDIVEDGGRFVGLRSFKIDGAPVSNDETPLRISITASDALVYEESRLLSVEVMEDGEIVLDTEIHGKVPSFPVWDDQLLHPVPPSQQDLARSATDRLKWHMRPEVRSVGSGDYRGLSISFEFSSESAKLHDIWLYSNWQLGDRLDGLRVVCQQWSASTSPWEWEACKDGSYTTSEHIIDDKGDCRKLLDMMVRGGGASALDFQFRPGQGAFARWFEDPGMVCSKVEKPAGSDSIYFYDRICCKGLTSHRTEKLMVMALDDPSLTVLSGRNLWLSAFADVCAEMASNYGLKKDDAEPMLFVDTVAFWPEHRPGKQAPDFYEKWTNRLDQVSDMGFKRILLHTPGWKCDATEGGPCNVCCPWDHVVADEFGGNAALAKFCDEAHAKGIEVIAWIGIHLSLWSTNLQKHPDWAVRCQDGFYVVMPEVGLNKPGDMNSGLKDHLLDQLRAVRECGVDGIWFDSFHNIGVRFVVEHTDGTRSLQAPATFDFLRQLQEMGFIIEIETISGLACSSCGIAWDPSTPHMQHVSELKGIEYTAYGTGLALRDDEEYWKFDRETFFRWMAHQAVLGINYRDVAGHEWEWPISLPSHIIELQRLYLRLAQYRGPIELIEGGVVWRRPDARLFWAFERVPLPDGSVDVTDEVPVPSDSTAEPGRVYLLK